MSDRPATVTPEQEAAWRCPRCGSSQSIGYGMWPNSGPLKAQCVPCGTVSDWPKIEREGETAERDKPVPRYSVGDGCSCTPYDQSAGGGYTEYLLEYEPACPEHSEHLWDPKQGAWVLRSERDAAVAAKALRAAADDVYASSGEGQWPKPSVIAYLRDRADRIEGEDR